MCFFHFYSSEDPVEEPETVENDATTEVSESAEEAVDVGEARGKGNKKKGGYYGGHDDYEYGYYRGKYGKEHQ